MATDDQLLTRAEIDSKVEAARSQLSELQRRKEELERTKNELEELRRKQDEFDRGRKEIIEGMTRGLAILEHEQVEATRLAELSKATIQTFKEMLEQVQSINEGTWTNPATLKQDLTKALAIIETARMEYNRARVKLDVLDKKHQDHQAEDNMALSPLGTPRVPSFQDQMKAGFAFSLPLIVVILLVLIVVILKT